MQTFVKTTLAAALSIAAVSPAIAGEQQIIVESQAAMQEWQQDVGRSLDRRLAYAERQLRVNPTQGIVQLRFTLDSNGKAQDITVITSSGDRQTDSVATRAVSGLTQLDDAPVVNAAAQTYQANIIFAEDQYSYKKLASALQTSEQTRLAQADTEDPVVSFGL